MQSLIADYMRMSQAVACYKALLEKAKKYHPSAPVARARAAFMKAYVDASKFEEFVQLPKVCAAAYLGHLREFRVLNSLTNTPWGP